MKQAAHATKLIRIAKRLIDELDAVDFFSFTQWVYNPLVYAWPAHELYIKRFASASNGNLFLGMNPGPWGMTQTGIPFGEVNAVRHWLGIACQIHQPKYQHPKRPIEGFACKRSEISGKRLWGLFQSKFNSPDDFFKTNFVINYCPLVFMDDSGRNLTPDKMPLGLRIKLQEICDRHLSSAMKILQPARFVGIGNYAWTAGQRVVAGDQALSKIQIGKILHPSPASPAANRNWAELVSQSLVEQGVWSDA